MKISLTLLALLFATMMGHGEESVSDQRKALAKVYLKEVIRKVASSPEGQRFFEGAKLDKIEFEDESDTEGWVLFWEYSKDVKYVPNPNPLGSALTIPVYGPDSISFTIVIEFGDAPYGLKRMGTGNRFVLSRDPWCEMRFIFGTKEKQPALFALLQEQCKAAQKALEIPPDENL